MSDQQRINGNAYSWSSIYLEIAGEKYYGFTSISYADSRSREKGYGGGRHHAPRSRSSGKYEVEPVAVKFEKATADAVRLALAQQSESGTSFGDYEFLIIVQYVEGDQEITDEIEQCTWTKTSNKVEESNGILYEEVEFDAMKIKWNGLYLFNDSEGA